MPTLRRKVYAKIVCAIQLLADLQLAGDSPFLVECLQEQSRSKNMDEVRRFIEVNNHEPVNIGDLEKYSVALPFVERKFSGDCWDAAV